jgi:hypothetical protein
MKNLAAFLYELKKRGCEYRITDYGGYFTVEIIGY